MIIIRTLYLVLMCLCLSSLSWADEVIHIKVVGNDNNKPKIYNNSAGEPSGVLVDILREVEKHSNLRFDISLYPWKRAYTIAERGDALITGLSYTTARTEIFDYSDVILNDDLVLVVKKGKEFPFNGVDDLKGKTLALNIGARFGDDLEKAMQNEVFEVVNVVERKYRFTMLLEGQADTTIVSMGKAGFKSFFNSEELFENRINDFSLLETPLRKDPNYMGFPKGMLPNEVREVFNKALNQVKNSGAIEKIIESHLDGS